MPCNVFIRRITKLVDELIDDEKLKSQLLFVLSAELADHVGDIKIATGISTIANDVICTPMVNLTSMGSYPTKQVLDVSKTFALKFKSSIKE